ncbi:DUF1127 domain-containing protein [Lutimaribacter marinistellae]|uniref:DUF1127 domain-containing protein n=1 Tax=Lutimaribacter marinistellae TaxID=1820329 RepID=A0ABV7TIT5_9RHOB
MAATTEFTATHASHTDSLDSWIGALRTRIARYRLYRQTVNELGALSGRELADLGLHRSMIKRIAIQAAYEATAR